mgnify:CR=1 FL=1
MKRICWPDGKDFAFTIIDDTDMATVSNVFPVYDYLLAKGIRTTKTVWTQSPRDYFSGSSLQDEDYCKFVLPLHKSGVEIAYHGAGSGDFTGAETADGLEKIRQIIPKTLLIFTGAASVFLR